MRRNTVGNPTRSFVFVAFLCGTPTCLAAEALFTLLDPEGDNVFDVFFEVTGGDNLGLATYNVALSNLDYYPIDSGAISWEEGVLSNFDTSFNLTGFNSGLLQGAVGTNSFSAANSQFLQTSPLLGVGQTPVFVEGTDQIPNNPDVDLGVPARLGSLDLGVGESFSVDELHDIFRPNAAVFDPSGDTSGVSEPEVFVTFGSPAEKRPVATGSGPIGPLVGEATYYFNDPDGDEVFDVLFGVEGGSSGLASYNIRMLGFDSRIDRDGIEWQEATLSNINTSLEETGFTRGVFEQTFGSGRRNYTVSNSQFLQPNPVYGVGESPVFVEGADSVPGNGDIDLDAPALLGTLAIPGANDLSESELVDLLDLQTLVFREADDYRTARPSSTSIVIDFTSVVPDPDPDPDPNPDPDPDPDPNPDPDPDPDPNPNPGNPNAVVTYYFSDHDRDEVYDVSIEVTGGSEGLATYNVALVGLDDSPIDADSIEWEEATLSNLGTDFVSRGFTGGLLQAAVGTDAFSAVNTQFQQTPIFGVGQTPIFVEAADVVPGNEDIVLGVPALLGQLSIPGANQLSYDELLALLSPNAAVFTELTNDSVSEPLAVIVVLGGFFIPEPSAGASFAVALLGVATRRRHGARHSA